MENKERNIIANPNCNELLKFVNQNKDTIIGLAELLKPKKRKKEYLSDEEKKNQKKIISNKKRNQNIKRRIFNTK